MSAESTLRVSNRPEIPARLPVAVALLWLAALATSAWPWFDQLQLPQLISVFWTFDVNNYVSVFAHFSWALRVYIAILMCCALGLACAVTQQVLCNPISLPTSL